MSETERRKFLPEKFHTNRNKPSNFFEITKQNPLHSNQEEEEFGFGEEYKNECEEKCKNTCEKKYGMMTTYSGGFRRRKTRRQRHTTKKRKTRSHRHRKTRQRK